MKKTIKIILYILPFILVLGIYLYLNDYYKADNLVYELIKESNISIKEENNGYFFDSEGTDDLIIFYPGAKVEAISYAPLMINLANNNIDCFIVKMPFNLALLNSNAANKIISTYKYNNYYLMGHSLGGAMASIYTSKNEEKIKGLILLASYSTKNIKTVNTLSIYGDKDNIINMKNYNKNKSKIDNLTEYIIKGANHSGYAFYGEQKNDYKSTISKEEQISNTGYIIKNFVRGE